MQMRSGGESTAHHSVVIADLRSKLAEADRQAAKLRRMIEELLEVYGDPFTGTSLPSPAIEEPKTVEPSQPYDGLGLGDACVQAIKALGGRATNQEITTHLAANNYKIKSSNPVNNVGTGLNHRCKARGDIRRDGRHWVIAVGKEQGAVDHINGAQAFN